MSLQLNCNFDSHRKEYAKSKCLGCILESISKKYMLEIQNLNHSLRRTTFFPKQEENIFAFWKKIRNVDYVCQILSAIQTSGDRYARQASVCSLKKYAVKGVRAFCLELVLHSFQMAFVSFNYVKSHIDRNPLAHVRESHSSLAIPEMCVRFKIHGSTERSNLRKA